MACVKEKKWVVRWWSAKSNEIGNPELYIVENKIGVAWFPVEGELYSSVTPAIKAARILRKQELASGGSGMFAKFRVAAYQPNGAVWPKLKNL